MVAFDLLSGEPRLWRCKRPIRRSYNVPVDVRPPPCDASIVGGPSVTAEDLHMTTITMSRNTDGTWNWTVWGPDGATIATGTATSRKAALSAARGAR